MKFLVIISLIKGIIRNIGQKAISYKLLLFANINTPVRIDLPINIRGKSSNIHLGKNNRLSKHSFLNCQGKLTTKSSTHFNQNTIAVWKSRISASVHTNDVVDDSVLARHFVFVKALYKDAINAESGNDVALD